MVAVVLGASLLGACSGDDSDDVSTGADGDVTTTSATGPATPDGGTEPAGSQIEVAGAWARTSPSMATRGAVYLVIMNKGEADDALVAASVDPSIAKTVEIHETVPVESDDDSGMGDGGSMDESTTTTSSGGGMHGNGMGMGMMEMRPVDEIPVPAGSDVELVPGGYHIMLLDLVEPLEAGEEIEVTLTFDAAGELKVMAEVREMPM